MITLIMARTPVISKINEGKNIPFFIAYSPTIIQAIDKDYLTEEDLKQLKEYQSSVVKMISPYLNKEEIDWIKAYTEVE